MKFWTFSAASSVTKGFFDDFEDPNTEGAIYAMSKITSASILRTLHSFLATSILTRRFLDRISDKWDSVMSSILDISFCFMFICIIFKRIICSKDCGGLMGKTGIASS